MNCVIALTIVYLMQKQLKITMVYHSLTHCTARNCSVFGISAPVTTKYSLRKVRGKRHHLTPDLEVFDGIFTHGSLHSGATFSRVMGLVMLGLQWKEVIVYLDDVILLGTDFSDTIAALHKVLDQFRQQNLKLKGRKCNFSDVKLNF